MAMRSVNELDEARQSFLAKLPKNYQGVACNFFLEPPRYLNIHEAGAALVSIHESVEERLAIAQRFSHGKDYERNSISNLRTLLQSMADDPEGALTLAEWAIAYVAMPEDQRQSRKTQQRQVWATEAMRGKPATPKQLDYLQKLGYDGEVTDRRHASDLINNLTRS